MGSLDFRRARLGDSTCSCAYIQDNSDFSGELCRDGMDLMGKRERVLMKKPRTHGA